MDKTYIHNEHEQRVYDLWDKSGGFTPNDNLGAKTFTIIMPPPNANDPLHVGHAMFVSVEDVLIRYHRMKGDATLWVPGTDHAGIETQFVFEKKLAKEGKSRFDFDRDTLFKMIWDYVKDNSSTAFEQMKRLGASADWSRAKFTLDPGVVELVVDTFKQLDEDGLVYRDQRLVNFCTKCGTSFSELEVVHVEQNDPLYFMKYGPFILATVRPETKFGDTALAVNPNDKRYAAWIGKEVEAEGLVGKFSIKVIADEYVDPEFGTGVVKITPAHDNNDFAVWQRHKDEIPGPKQVIGFDGKLNELAGPYKGLNVVEGRRRVVEDLTKAGLIEKVDSKYVHNVGTCYRCGRILEPLPLPQFYIKVKSLTEKVLKSLINQEVVVLGAGYDKILKHWLENLNDWNVSRQIVWGIRLPIWYQIDVNKELRIKNKAIEVVFIDKDGERQIGKIGELLEKFNLEEIKTGLQSLRAPMDAEYVVSPTPPGENYLQETDTFDTWFSSAQWPFVTLMSDSKSKTENGDFVRFYPTQVMETAYDILMFWVMRMLMLGLYKTGKTPFEKVYLHGLIRDDKGQKMSKSKGNVINPISVIDKYGADALRMALLIRSTPGLDKNVGEQDFKAMRNLTNKIWNAARYILLSENKQVTASNAAQASTMAASNAAQASTMAASNAAGQKSKTAASNAAGVRRKIAAPNTTQASDKKNNKDKEFLKKLDGVVRRVGGQLDSLKIGLAAETVYGEFWHWYCDEAIESNKQEEISDRVLLVGLVTFLKLLHPFTPFVTEAVWSELKEAGLISEQELLMVSVWPEETYK